MERVFMEQVIRDRLHLKLCGMITLNGGSDDDFRTVFFKKENDGVKLANYAAVAGHPDGISVEVFEYLHKEKRLRPLEPFHNRNGIKEFESEYDIYVVLTNESGLKRFYAVGHRFFAAGRVVWEGFECRALPPVDEREKRPDKPLAQHMQIPLRSEPPNGDGPTLAEEDRASKDAMAGTQLLGDTRSRGPKSMAARPEDGPEKRPGRKIKGTKARERREVPNVKGLSAAEAADIVN